MGSRSATLGARTIEASSPRERMISMSSISRGCVSEHLVGHEVQRNVPARPPPHRCWDDVER